MNRRSCTELLTGLFLLLPAADAMAQWAPTGALAKVPVVRDCNETAGDVAATRLDPPTIYLCPRVASLVRQKYPGAEHFYSCTNSVTSRRTPPTKHLRTAGQQGRWRTHRTAAAICARRSSCCRIARTSAAHATERRPSVRTGSVSAPKNSGPASHDDAVAAESLNRAPVRMQGVLFDPARHEALADTAWDESRARAAIASIVQDIEQGGVAGGQWPAHPLDLDGGETVPEGGFKSLYLGSAGVLWALWTLQREGAVPLASDPADRMAKVHAAYLAAPDTGKVVPSFMLGEAGVLLLRWRMTGSNEAADRLFASVESNIANPTNEMLWAAPGTMLAARHLWQATADERWRALFVANVDRLWETWHFDEEAQCHLWTQDMYGKVVQYIGAGHGFAGNVHPLLKGASLLDEERREVLYVRCVETLSAFAEREDDAINWRPGTFVPRAGPKFLMQWCHGAPGMVTALADFPAGRSADIDAMLIGAGHAVWQAGPLAKGFGICHGTAGNGYAFLKLHQRTGDAMWLERARSFAMHSIAQAERMKQRYGQGRHTLWNGEAGLAIYLWHCIAGQAGLPGLDAV